MYANFCSHVTPGILRYHIYYGKDRSRTPMDLKNLDLVITTYSVVSKEWERELSGKQSHRQLHSARWHRIVLDEGKVTYRPILVQYSNVNSTHHSSTLHHLCQSGLRTPGGKKMGGHWDSYSEPTFGLIESIPVPSYVTV
jgi:hypothetical protein